MCMSWRCTYGLDMASRTSSSGAVASPPPAPCTDSENMLSLSSNCGSMNERLEEGGESEEAAAEAVWDAAVDVAVGAREAEGERSVEARGYVPHPSIFSASVTQKLVASAKFISLTSRFLV